MKISVATFTVHKRFALKISRGTTAESENVWVKIEQDGIEGWGEASPFSIGEETQTTEDIIESLQPIIRVGDCFHASDRQQIEQLMIEYKTPSAAKAALDVALHDWLGKKIGLPLWKLWGFQLFRIVPTSVTIGINSPEGARDRLQQWLNFTKVKAVKIKLGSPEGIEADRAMFLAVVKGSPKRTKISVDANAGWTLKDAKTMCEWLADYKVQYVEQPLPVEETQELLELYEQSPLPIFVDESCWQSADIPKLADRVHGVNIKLMKCGGLTEALRMIHTAKACKLKVMFGCYSDSTLANTAIAHLAPLADYLDLDSHLNLIDDPFIGATMNKGCLIPNDLPGLGVDRASNS
jgi:L-alanine-DL-glutamate epimerase-like enolase superfamily enzyme